MNLLRVIASMDPVKGGPCQGIRNSIPEMEKLCVHNEVVSLDNPDAYFLKKDPFKIHALGSGKSPWGYNSKLIPWLINNLSRFDAVIVHGLWLYQGYAVRKAINLLKTRRKTVKGSTGKIPKLFLMPHGMLDPYFQRAKGRKLKAIRNWFYWKLIEQHVVNEADGVLFTCEAELQLAREPFYPYKPKQEINVGYGIAEPPLYHNSLSNAFSQMCPQLAGKPFILFLSRIHEKKGVDLLIKAYAQVLKKVLRNKGVLTSADSIVEETLDTPTQLYEFPRLVIAGPGLETPYGQYIQKIAVESPELQEFVFFPGMLIGDAKWGAFYGCEAFVLPSHQENFGIAVVEALACGKPVLISNQVNIWREIEAKGGGLVSEDTKEGTYKLLEKWHNLPILEKQEMRENARVTYRTYFALEQNVFNFLEAVNK